MNKKIITSIIIALIAFAIAMGIVCNTTDVAGQREAYSKEELITLINECQQIKDDAHAMAESARKLGWTDDDDLIIDLKAKWNKADSEQKEYQAKLDVIIEEEQRKAQKAEEERIAAEQKAAEEAEAARQAEEAKWAQKAAEYPAATQIWRYMKALGWNDYVCAGIMGNLMAEVGGQTLNIRYTLSSNNYYGMCQWSRSYSKVWGTGLETQCDFLRDTIQYEFDTYGSKYQKGFNFNSFLNMTDAQQAALAFAKSYERCSSKYYTIRQQNALKAYNYFVN